MSAKIAYVPDLFGEVVAKVNTKLLAGFQAIDATITGINYLYGPMPEIIETLTEMTNSASGKKYPLVALIIPIIESHGKQIGIIETSPIRIIIARWGNATDKTPARYANNIKPFLYPIYSEMLNQIDADKRFLTQSANLIPHSKVDWPYYGGDNPPAGANPFSDKVDAVEIRDLLLKINLKQNLKN